jgi:hypothetical protein
MLSRQLYHLVQRFHFRSRSPWIIVNGPVTLTVLILVTSAKSWYLQLPPLWLSAPLPIVMGLSYSEPKIPFPKSNVLPPKRHVRISSSSPISRFLGLESFVHAARVELVKNFCFSLILLSRPFLSPGDALFNHDFPRTRPQNCNIYRSELTRYFVHFIQLPRLRARDNGDDNGSYRAAHWPKILPQHSTST